MFSLSPTKGRIATIALGALLTVACAEDTGELEQPSQPITMAEAAVPLVDAAPAVDASTGVVGQPEAGASLDSGVLNPVLDASKPSADATAGDTGPVTLPDAATDAAVSTDSAVSTDAGGTGTGTCCPDGKCLCHGPDPKGLTSARGPYKTANYTIAGTGCVYYPTDAEPPYAAVTISDGFLGAGGCGSFQTGNWGPLYASWGIVAMIVNTGSADQPNARGRALLKGITAFKAENTKSGSPLNGKLAGRYGTSGFSMGGGGTSYASRDDKTLLSSVAIMPWGPVTSGITTPTLVICGSSDGTAPCGSHGNPLYRGIAASVPKMRVQVNSGHQGQPSAGGGDSGEYGLAFQKVFLEGDQRWRPFLVSARSEETTIK
jgi:hypothetical protein